jgi:SAM-dependent methyltransferase
LEGSGTCTLSIAVTTGKQANVARNRRWARQRQPILSGARFYIDMSPAMIRLCQAKGISACVMDIDSLGFESNSFDAVYALNSFLHLQKSEFPVALVNVRNALRPDGLFYLGIYGGYDFEGVWGQDSYTPKRFFSFYSDENLKKFLIEYFKIVYFKNIQLGEGNIAFQSVILRKRAH